MAASEAWRGIWIKTERAKEHILDLQRRVDGFMRRRPYSIFIDRDPATGHHVIRAHVTEEPPIWWGAIAGDAVHNLRSALDLMISQLILANGALPDALSGFPIAGSAAEYEELRPLRLRGVAPEIAGRVDALRPYRGGNDLLWRMQQLDTQDQQLALRPVGAAAKAYIDVISGLDFPNTPLTISPGYPNRVVFPVESGTELARVFRKHLPSQLEVKDQGAFYIAFGEPQALAGAPLMPTLNTLVRVTENTLRPFVRLLLEA